MSKGIRRPVVKTPFETKRVIVAACAAVAMVMGAMSVTSSISSAGDPDKARSSSLMTPTVQAISSQPVASSELTSKHTIEVRGLIQQSAPLYNTTPKVTKVNKPMRETITQVLATVNPTLFLTEIVQIQQPVQPASSTPSTSSTSTGDTSSSDTSTKTGSEDSSTSTDAGSDTTNPTKDSSSTSTDPSQQSQSQSTVAPSSTTNTPSPANP